jgi:glycosyltransferase involved in cell wall biosynthesis
VSRQPLVSTVVIFRDAMAFLDESIASVFAQTYPNWELLLVDDGSSDGSSELARDWAERHPFRVRYLTHPENANRGMSASRNLGIAHACGEYLAFLDADDVWLPPKLSQQVALLEAWPKAAMVYGPTQWWYSWSGRAEDQERDFVRRPGVPLDCLLQPPLVLTHFLANDMDSPCTCSILVRSAVANQVGGFEDVFRGLYEDQAFCAKVCLHFPVIASDQCWYRYRQHPDSACAVAERTGQARGARQRFLIWLHAYLKEHGADNDVWLTLERELDCCRQSSMLRGIQRARRLIARIHRGIAR